MFLVLKEENRVTDANGVVKVIMMCILLSSVYGYFVWGSNKKGMAGSC